MVNMYSATSGETPQRCSRPGNTKPRSKRMVFKRLRKRRRERPRSSLRRLNEPSLGTLKSWYKTYLFKQSFDCHWLFELVYSALSFGLSCVTALHKSSYYNYCRAWLRTVAALFPDSGTPASSQILGVLCVHPGFAYLHKPDSLPLTAWSRMAGWSSSHRLNSACSVTWWTWRALL